MAQRKKADKNNKSERSSCQSESWEETLEEAVRLHKQGRIDIAQKLYRDLLERGISHPALKNNYALVLKQKGSIIAGRDELRRIVMDDKERADSWANLAECERQLGNCHNALHAIDRAIELEKAKTIYWRIKAAVFDQLGQFRECAEIAEYCRRLGDDNLEIRCIHALALCETGRIDEGRMELDSLYSARDTLKAGDKARLARALNNLGELERGEILLCEALQIEPGCIPAILATVQTLPRQLSRFEEESLTRQLAMCEDGVIKANILFAIGRNLEKAKRFRDAFEAWKEASKLKLQNLDIKQAEDFWNRGERALRAERKLRLKGNDYMPSYSGRGKGRIFIVGLPRSGSTLLETILNRIEGSRDLGECKMIGKASTEVFRTWRSRYDLLGEESLFDHLDSRRLDGMFREISVKYSMLTDTFPETRQNGVSITTDKMLYNYNNLPILIRAFPGCKIVHIHRNPLDNFLSMFKENFKEGNEFSYCIDQMVDVYDAHMKLVQESDKLFPGYIVECHYDSLVRDPDSYLPTLFASLGIEWKERYLTGGRERELIRTASVVQARSGINADSLGKWKNYSEEFAEARKRLEAMGYEIG